MIEFKNVNNIKKAYIYIYYNYISDKNTAFIFVITLAQLYRGPREWTQ